jgi:hypothetical protein
MPAIICNSGGESVSISEVAKTLLESAKDDRLDFRLEAVLSALTIEHGDR